MKTRFAALAAGSVLMLLAGGCPPEKPLYHRPTAIACAPTFDAGINSADGGVLCSGSPPGPIYCADQCLVDDDCGTGSICSCAGSSFGFSHETTNLCVAAGCRTDADCGPNGFCSPSVGANWGNFYGIESWECHGPGDTCVNDTDCGATSPGKLGQPYCAYFPEVGHWACGTATTAG